MSKTVWRIAADTPRYEADDLSGAGAKATGGRWNAAGLACVYASESRSLACLETVVHLNAGGLPLNRYLVGVTIPDDVWAAAEVVGVGGLPVGWDAAPAGRASIAFGSDWLRARRSAVLVVPSVVVPEEWCVVVNPLHSDGGRVGAVKVRKWVYDPRVVKGG